MREYWKPVLLLVGGIALWVIFRRKDGLAGVLRRWEQRSSDAHAALEARKALRRQTHEEAVEAIELKYAAARQKLDTETLAQMEDLKDDPIALARRYNQLARQYGANPSGEP